MEDYPIVDLDELEAQVVDLDALEGKPRPAPPRPKPRPSKKPRQPIVPIKVTPEMVKATQLELNTDALIRGAAEDKTAYGYKRPTKIQQIEDSIDPVTITGRKAPKRPARPTKGPLISDLPEVDPVTGKPLGPPALEQPGWGGQIVNKALRIPMVGSKLAESAGEAVDALVYGLGRLEGQTPEELAQNQTRLTPYIKKVTEGYVSPFIRGFAPQDPAKQGYAADTAAGGLASAGEFLLAGWLGRAIGVPSKVVSGTVGAGLNINEALTEADKLGASPDQRAVLTLLSGLTGLTEMGGLGKSIEGFGLSRLFKDRVREVLEEGGQEALQTWLNNLNMVVTRVDPDRPLTRDVLEAAILGGFVGGVFQGVSYGKERLFRPSEKPALPVIRREDVATIPPPPGYVPPPPRQRPVPKSMQSSKLRPGWDMMLMSRGTNQETVTDPNERDDNLMEWLRESQAFTNTGDPRVGYYISTAPTEHGTVDVAKVSHEHMGEGMDLFLDPELASEKAMEKYRIPASTLQDDVDHPDYDDLVRDLYPKASEKYMRDRSFEEEYPLQDWELRQIQWMAEMDARQVIGERFGNRPDNGPSYDKSPNLRPYYMNVKNPFRMENYYPAQQAIEMLRNLRRSLRNYFLERAWNDKDKQAARDRANEIFRIEEDELLDGVRPGTLDDSDTYQMTLGPGMFGREIYAMINRIIGGTESEYKGMIDYESDTRVNKILSEGGFDGLVYTTNESKSKEFKTMEEAEAYADRIGGRVTLEPTILEEGKTRWESIRDPNTGFITGTQQVKDPDTMSTGPTVIGSSVWKVFDGQQIKSSTGNSGNFSATDPRVYKDTSGLTPLEASKLDDMVFDVMPALRSGQAPYLRAPRWTVHAMMPGSGGLNIPLERLGELIDAVNLRAPSPEHANEAITAITDLAEQAEAEGINSISMVANDASEEQIRGVIEHEVTHAGERFDFPDIQWVFNHPLIDDVLRRKPYGPKHPDPLFQKYGENETVQEVMFSHLEGESIPIALTMEIPSYFVQGRLDKLGMSEQEGRQFFKDYLNHIRDQHGQQAVDKFRNVTRMRQGALDVIDESNREWREWQQQVREMGPERSAILNNYNPGLDGPLDLGTLYSRGDLVYPPNVRVDDIVRRVGDTNRAKVIATHNDGVFVEYIEGERQGMTERLPWSMTIEAADPNLTPQQQVRKEIERKPIIPAAGEVLPRIGGQAGVQQNSSPVFQLGQVVRALDKEGDVMDEDMTIVELDTDEYGPIVRAQRHDDGGVGEFRLDRIMMASDVGRPVPRHPKLQKHDPTKGKERRAAMAPPPSGPNTPEPPQLPPSGDGRPFRHPRIMVPRMDNDYQRAVDRAYASLLEKGGVTLDPTRRVFLQVVDALEEGKITSEQFDEALEENGMTFQQFTDEYKVTVHEAALTLNELSRIKAKYKNIIKNNKNLADKFLSVADQFDALMDELNDTILGKNVWQRGGSLIRMMMLSDLRTAFVNAWVTTGRIPLSIVNHGLGAFMHSMHKSKGNPHGLRDRLKVAARDFNRATQIGTEVLLALRPSELIQNREKTPTGGMHQHYQEIIDQLIKQFPELHGKLIAPGIGDVGVSELGTKLDEARTLAGSIKDLPSREKALNDLKKFEDRHRSNMNNWMKKGLYGAEWAMEWTLKPMRWQELLFRRPMFVAYLDYALEKRNLSFTNLLTNKELGKIPEEVLNEAVDEALDFTYSYMPHADEQSPWAEKRAAEFINAINRLGPISAMAGIAFPRAVYNGVKFVYEYSPLGAMPYFVKKFRQRTGRDIIHDPTLPNVSYQAQGTALTERDFQRVAKAMVGTLMYATAIGLIKAGLIGDEWWKLKVPFGSKLTDSGNPLYIDLRKFQPLSTFVRLADMSLRAGSSLLDTDAFGRQRGDMHMGQELKEIFTGLRNFPGLEESTNAFFEMWDDGTGASWDKGMQSVGMSLSWMTRPLINVRDAVAIFMDEEQKQKDLKGTGLWGPLVDNVPWLRSYLLENKTDPNKGVVENMFAPALSFPMGAKMIEGENFAGREWRRLGLLNKTFLPSESDPIMNRARNEAFFEFMDEVASEFENDPAYLEASDDDKAAMWEIMAKEARPIANEAGKAANPEEDAKAKAREASGMGPKQRKAAGFEDELK